MTRDQRLPIDAQTGWEKENHSWDEEVPEEVPEEEGSQGKCEPRMPPNSILTQHSRHTL